MQPTLSRHREKLVLLILGAILGQIGIRIANSLGAFTAAVQRPQDLPNAVVVTARSLKDTPRFRAFAPYYTKCFQRATFSYANTTGRCGVVNDALRKHATVQVDAHTCQWYLDDHSDEKAALSSLTVDRPALDAVKASLASMELHLRPWSTDVDVLWQVYCGGDFGFLHQLIQYVPVDRPVTVLDAGGNVGFASILFAQLIRGQGEVLALEANPETMKVLEKNVAPFSGIVKPVLAALVSHEMAHIKPTIEFAGVNNQYWGFRVDHKEKNYEGRVSMKVNTTSLTTLQEMTKQKHFDFIKLDIEGEERRILSDPVSAQVLCEATCIFMELHDRFEPGCRAAFDEFLARGCPNNRQFRPIVTTGEYEMVCRSDKP